MAGISKLLTEQDVEQIFELHYVHGMKKQDIAEKFGIGWHYCHRVLTGQRLKYWTGPLVERYCINED